MSELALPSTNCHTNGRTFELTTDLTRIAPLHDGSLVVLGLKLITSNYQRLKETGWANRRITHHTNRSDAAIRRYWQEWFDDRFRRHDGRGWPRATADWENRLIVRSAVTTPDS
ncbi:hypothetical protein TNCV_2911861 [Trichonephila clavipes]|nr:hypothetical protein TNCV_2911861 [Trichonephila clavipes]